MEQREIDSYFHFIDVFKSIGPAAIPSTIGLYISNQVTRDLIAANNKATNDLIATNNQATKDLIAAESIKSSEARIDNILQDFKISFKSSANNKGS